MSIVKGIKNMFAAEDGDNEYMDDETDEMPMNEYVEEDEMDAPNFTTSNRNNTRNINEAAQLKVVLVKPTCFEDAGETADHLNAKRTVVLNLESVDQALSRRLLDFLSGVAYANDATLQRVANSTFIITPGNVALMGELMDEFGHDGAFH